MDTTRRQEFGHLASEGTRLLREAMAREGLKPSELLRQLLKAGESIRGVDSASLSRVIWGRRRPGRVLADRLRETLGIAPGAWDAPPAGPIG